MCVSNVMNDEVSNEGEGCLHTYTNMRLARLIGK